MATIGFESPPVKPGGPANVHTSNHQAGNDARPPCRLPECGLVRKVRLFADWHAVQYGEVYGEMYCASCGATIRPIRKRRAR